MGFLVVVLVDFFFPPCWQAAEASIIFCLPSKVAYCLRAGGCGSSALRVPAQRCPSCQRQQTSKRPGEGEIFDVAIMKGECLCKITAGSLFPLSPLVVVSIFSLSKELRKITPGLDSIRKERRGAGNCVRASDLHRLISLITSKELD